MAVVGERELRLAMRAAAATRTGMGPFMETVEVTQQRRQVPAERPRGELQIRPVRRGPQAPMEVVAKAGTAQTEERGEHHGATLSETATEVQHPVAVAAAVRKVVGLASLTTMAVVEADMRHGPIPPERMRSMRLLRSWLVPVGRREMAPIMMEVTAPSVA